MSFTFNDGLTVTRGTPPPVSTPEEILLSRLLEAVGAMAERIDLLGSTIASLDAPSITFPEIPAPVVQSGDVVADVDFTPVLVALGRLEVRLAELETTMRSPRVRTVQRDPGGNIVATHERLA